MSTDFCLFYEIMGGVVKLLRRTLIAESAFWEPEKDTWAAANS